MTTEINVVSRTQEIVVVPNTKTVSVINAGPRGPAGPPGVGPVGDLWIDPGVSHITGDAVQHEGPIFTNHDAKYWWAGDQAFQGNATFVPNGATIHACSLWDFSNTATQWIKWQWVPGDGWEAYDIRFGVVNPGFASANNSRWRYSEERVTVNQGSPGGVMTNTPVEVASATVASPGALGTGNAYGNIAVDVAAPGPLDLIFSTIERVHDHADDTYASALSIYLVTATRVDG